LTLCYYQTMEQTTQPNTSQQPAAASVSMDDKTLAIFAHVGVLLSGFIVPLIIWLIQKDKNTASSREALEALNFGITLVLAWIVAGVLSLVLIGFLLYPVLFVAQILFPILGAVSASNGKPYTYPVSLRLIK